MSLVLIGCGGGSSSGTGGTGGTSGTSATSSAAATGTSASAAPGFKLVTDGTLTIGSDCDYPPFIFMDGDQAQGFERDLMEAVATNLGLTLQYLPPQNFDTILVSIAAGGKMDLGVSSFTITDDRKELVDFCIPYFDSNQAVVALKSNNYSGVADLAGKTIGAQSGTTGEAWALENIPDITMKSYNQTSDAMAALMTGDIDAAIYDEPVAAEHVSTTYTDAEIIQSIATGEQYGMAVSKDNPELRDAVNKALLELKADGTFDRIFKQWFPNLDPPALTAS